ncbi:MAG: HEAT repeat domain-containing protein [Phycisphaerales bacterium]
MIGDHPQSKRVSPLQEAARLGVRDRIVALGASLRSAQGADCDAMAMPLIELAARNGGQREQDGQQAAGPVELITRIPSRWRERHADEALMTLARGWAKIPKETRPLALSIGRDRWLQAVRELGARADVESRLAALDIAYDTADPGLGKVACVLLKDEEQRVRHRADETVMRMSMRLLRGLPEALLGEHYAGIAELPVVAFPADPDVLRLERCVLMRAVADAAYDFASHRCRSPLIALLLLIDHPWASRMERQLCDRMRRLLGSRNHPSHAPLRSVLKRTDCPLLRERAFRWLPIEAISSAAIERLRVADTNQEHEMVLGNAELALRPRRASKLAMMSAPRTRERSGALLPENGRWGILSEQARLGALRLNAIVGDDEAIKRLRIEPALADKSAHVRLRGAALCPALDLQEFVFDPDPVVSRHATLRWCTLGIEPPRLDAPSSAARVRLCVLASRSPHAQTRSIGDLESSRLRIDDAHCPASRQRARRYMQADPAGFIRLVRDRMALTQTRVQAIMLIRMLGVERRFELDLIGLVQSEHTDARSRACAVAALAGVDTNTARYVLEESMRDPDARTRANAIEHAAVSVRRLIELGDDSDHRVRANAIRRAIAHTDLSDASEARDASGALIELLGDPRPMHRLAGSWVAQHTMITRNRERLGTRWSPIIAQLEELAAVDENPRLRERAARCIRRLTAEIRSGASVGVAERREA